MIQKAHAILTLKLMTLADLTIAQKWKWQEKRNRKSQHKLGLKHAHKLYMVQFDLRSVHNVTPIHREIALQNICMNAVSLESECEDQL